MDRTTRIPWRKGARIRTIGPNPERGGKYPPTFGTVIEVQHEHEAYVVLYDGKRKDETVTFEASAHFWLLIEDGPADELPMGGGS